MIDEKKDCVAKLQLKITVKTLRKCYDSSRVAAKHTDKQTQDTETSKHLDRKTKAHTYKQIHKQSYKWTHAQREVNKNEK